MVVKLSPRPSCVGGILAPGILERPAPSSPPPPGLVPALEEFPRVGSWCWRCPEAVWPPEPPVRIRGAGEDLFTERELLPEQSLGLLP